MWRWPPHFSEALPAGAVQTGPSIHTGDRPSRQKNPCQSDTESSGRQLWIDIGHCKEAAAVFSSSGSAAITSSGQIPSTLSITVQQLRDERIYMKKRILSVLLAITLMIPVITVPASAAGQYSRTPILTGYADVDYQADQILSEIPTAGKDTVGQIQAVYDWIITHCNRYNWDGKYYYDQNAVAAAAKSYELDTAQRLSQGNAVIRQEMEKYWGISSSDYSFDANYSLSYKAREMMLKRTGDCVNYSALFAVLLGHLGYDAHIISGYFINPGGSKVSHKWNYVLIDGKYYWFDIRIDHSFYDRRGRNTIPHDYFMVEDTKTWEKTHSWDHTLSNLLAANASTVNTLYNEAVRQAMGIEAFDEIDVSRGSLSNYRKINTYTQGQFRDVSSDAWYCDNVKEAFEYGLLLGMDDGSFGTGSSLTVAQTLAIADRLHNQYYGGSGVFYQGFPWYQVYIDYALKYQIISKAPSDPSAPAARAQFAEIMSAALPDEALQAINDISSIPDVSSSAPYAAAVYRLYNAGILNGNDEYGTFCPDTPINREQIAAMATRFANPDLRKHISIGVITDQEILTGQDITTD